MSDGMTRLEAQDWLDGMTTERVRQYPERTMEAVIVFRAQVEEQGKALARARVAAKALAEAAREIKLPKGTEPHGQDMGTTIRFGYLRKFHAALASLIAALTPAPVPAPETCKECGGTGRIVWTAGGKDTVDPCPSCAAPSKEVRP